MITYRIATPRDVTTIGQLHARSWQKAYKGILTEEYLNYDVEKDLGQKWSKRFNQANPKQFALIAEENGEALGFVCTLLEEDKTYGALLDNLHVLPGNQGKGIGANLLYASAKWTFEQNPDSDMYLFVYVDNPAVKFYERLGGIRKGRSTVDNPGGGRADIYRYVWPDLKQWLSKFAYLVEKG